MRHNWKEIRQDLINDLVSIKKDARSKLSQSISNDINKASHNTIKTDITKSGVEFNPPNTTEAQKGKLYFDTVFQSIDQNYVDKNT